MAEKEKKLCLTDRKKLYINDVREVQSFDENEVVLTTELGELTVEGSDIHISNLDTAGGVVEINGTINVIAYSDESAGKKRGLRARLFG